jgi:hypothetical protein
MHDEQTDQSVEPTAEDTTETEGASADESAVADAVDQQAAASDGTAAEAEPEVPDDASQTIAAAQQHLSSLNMDEERQAAEQAQKKL